jgi:hypothetical protein
MSSPSTIHLPADAIPRRANVSGTGERPVVLLAFAKLVLLIGSADFLGPIWLALVGEALAAPNESWLALRLLVLSGSVSLLAIAMMALKVWTRLLKHLALAN